METKLLQIELSKIILDASTQPRAAIDEYIVNEYQLDMMAGDNFPPLVVFSNNGDDNYYLADGWHRFLAAKNLQRETIDCAVIAGGVRDAVLYSVSANADHGKRRTNGDKERAVKKLLKDPEWFGWSDNAIARQCRVSNHFVAKLRSSVTWINPSDRKYTNKYGGESTMNTANIGTKEEQATISRDDWLQKWSADNLTIGLDELGDPVEEHVAQPQQPEYDPINYRLFTAPINKISDYIEPNSIDAIITDPPYPREYIHVYKEMAEQAAIVLKPGGILVALAGHNYIDILISQMKEYLEYQWIGCYYMPTGQHASLPIYSVSVYWKPLLIFCKGRWPRNKTFKDVFINDEADKNYHEWGQGISGFSRIIQAFTLPNETVLDPFVGGGTTAIAALDCGRYFIGSDISPDEVEKTARRLNNG